MRITKMRFWFRCYVVVTTMALAFVGQSIKAGSIGESGSNAAVAQAPLAELHVTPVYSGPGCCWIFELTQVWGAPGNIVQVVGQVTTPGATITSAQILCTGTISNTSTTVNAFIPNGLTPTNPPGVPSCSLRICFSSPLSPNVHIVFNAYDAAGNTSPCPPCLMQDTVTVSDASCTQGCVSPPPNCVLWLPFNEAAGPIAYNAAGGNNGVEINSPTIINQYVKRGLCFNGSNQWVDVKTYPAINFGPVIVGTKSRVSFSIDAWIRREGGDLNVRTIVDKRLDSAGGVWGYHLYLFNGQLAFQLANGTGVNYNSLTTVPPDNQWHFVAVTVKRNDPTGLTFYLDGVPVGPTYSTIPHNGSLATSAPFRVGARTASTPGTAVFMGCIDEVEVFRRVLLPAEILSIYNAKTDGKCIQRCILPSMVGFCVNVNTVTVNAQICNNTGFAQTYSYSFVGLPVSAGCSVNGPTVFSPPSGTVTVPNGTCVSIPVTITRPAGLTCNAVGCYEMDVSLQTSTGIQTFSCHGAVRGLCLYCLNVPPNLPPQLSAAPFPVGPFSVTNTGAQKAILDYQFIVMNHDGMQDDTEVRLNGLPPGEPVFGTLSLAPGESSDIGLTAEFDDDNPMESYEIVLEADLDGDGVPEPLAVQTIENMIPPSFIPGDANGDGTVNVTDVVYLISYIFSAGPTPVPLEAADANCDGLINISDVVYLVAYIFGGGSAPCGGALGKLAPGLGELTPNGALPLSATLMLTGIGQADALAGTGAVDMHSDVPVAGVQLEFGAGIDRPDEIAVHATDRSRNLQLFSGVRDGVFRVGLVDLSGKNTIAAGDGPILTLEYKGDKSDLGLTSAVICDPEAKTLNVKIVTEGKGSTLPTEYSLNQNHPNPFNPSTDISFAMPKSSEVRVEVINMLGQSVKTLVSGFQATGTHKVTWDGTDAKGVTVSSGVYFYRMVSGEFTDTKKMVLMK